ncbi:3788_t:CDS:2 [Cetraspora pellucida]|uniref:3788_t:CDS:1 n=1 Tax=Cetraspora pellucida TaxID=1433469 RepID=A0A9N8WT21_9GLOM|nr:3788_t:CDS:2 [Cetraspora pellucida]
MKSTQLFFIVFGLLAFTLINSSVSANNFDLNMKCESAGTNEWVLDIMWTPQESMIQQLNQIDSVNDTNSKPDPTTSPQPTPTIAKRDNSKKSKNWKNSKNRDVNDVVILLICKNLGYYDSMYGRYSEGRVRYNLYGRKSWKSWFGRNSWKNKNDKYYDGKSKNDKYYDGDNYFGDNDYDSYNDYRGNYRGDSRDDYSDSYSDNYREKGPLLGISNLK